MFEMINLSSDTLKLDTGHLGGQCVNFHENWEKSKEVLDKITNVWCNVNTNERR